MTRDEFIAEYRRRNPTTSYTDAQLRQFYDSKDYVINRQTDRLNNIHAGDYGPPDVTARFRGANGEAVDQRSDARVREFNPLENAAPQQRQHLEGQAAQRTQELENARNARQAGDETTAKAAEQRAREISHQLGVEAGRAYYREHLASQGFEPLGIGPEGARVFDQVYVNRSTGEVILVEAKGGSGGLGDRFGADGRTRVQQGTVEYVQAILADGRTPPETAIKIETALREQQLRYLEVRQTFSDSGSLGPVQVTEFAMPTRGAQ